MGKYLSPFLLPLTLLSFISDGFIQKELIISLIQKILSGQSSVIKTKNAVSYLYNIHFNLKIIKKTFWNIHQKV